MDKSTGIGASIATSLPKAKLVKVRSITPKLNPAAKRIIATYGPYVLAGKGVCKPQPFNRSKMCLANFYK
jgi:hypothetical protein